MAKVCTPQFMGLPMNFMDAVALGTPDDLLKMMLEFLEGLQSNEEAKAPDFLSIMGCYLICWIYGQVR